MLDLETNERAPILQGFQSVIDHLKSEYDEKLLTGLALLNKGKYHEADMILIELNRIDQLLTPIRSYLESNYTQAVSLH